MRLPAGAPLQDSRLSRELRPHWDFLDMGRLRAEAIAEVDADIGAEIFTSWDDVVHLIDPFPRGDTVLEGLEIEPALRPGEAVHLDEEPVCSDLSDSDSDDDGGGGGAPGGAIVAAGAAPAVATGPGPGPSAGGGEGSAAGSEPGRSAVAGDIAAQLKEEPSAGAAATRRPEQIVHPGG